MLLELQQERERIGKVEKVLEKIASQEPAVGLLMTIPGVGIRTAEAVVAYIDQADRFRRTKSVGCYFGMVPCEDTSVKSRFGHITKEGPPTVRKYLTEATWQAIRRDESIRAFYERVRREDPKRKRIALVATAHHLLRVMLAMLRSGECWHQPGTQKDWTGSGAKRERKEPSGRKRLGILDPDLAKLMPSGPSRNLPDIVGLTGARANDDAWCVPLRDDTE